MSYVFTELPSHMKMYSIFQCLEEQYNDKIGIIQPGLCFANVEDFFQLLKIVVQLYSFHKMWKHTFKGPLSRDHD